MTLKGCGNIFMEMCSCQISLNYAPNVCSSLPIQSNRLLMSVSYRVELGTTRKGNSCFVCFLTSLPHPYSNLMHVLILQGFQRSITMS